jgi:hypothetical protein
MPTLRKTDPLLSKKVDPFGAHWVAKISQFNRSDNPGRNFRYDFGVDSNHARAEGDVIFPWWALAMTDHLS